MDIDEALALVGGYRRWHITIFILLGISLFQPICWQGLVIVFIGWEPAHLCRVDSSSGEIVNGNISQLIEDDGNEAQSRCTMYLNSSTGISNTTTPCVDGWNYANDGYYTIVEQWDLVCERNYLSEMSQTVFQIGSLVAEIVFSYMVDRFGRKKVHILSHLAICVVGVGTAFSNSYTTFIIFRSILGMLTVANINSGLTECMELFDSKRRAFAGIGLEFQWIFCYLLLPVLAYFITDWRHLQFVISLSSAIWIIYFWILPESPTWLVAVGKFDEAERLLHKMAKWNGVKIEPKTQLLSRPKQLCSTTENLYNKDIAEETKFFPEDHKTNQDSAESKTTDERAAEMETLRGPLPAVIPFRSDDLGGAGGEDVKHGHITVPILDLLKDRYLRIYLVVCSLLWLANCLVYYGLILSIPTLAGNRFINFLIMGFVELPAVFLALYTTQKFGRRLSTVVYHIAAGIPLMIVVFIPKTTASGTDLSPLILTLVMLSKFAISASFSVIILYTKELFPTNLRGTSSGICQFLGRIGNIFTPFAAYGAKTSFYWLPNILFGSTSIVVGLVTLVLPETSGHPLPQTLDDVHIIATAKSDKIRKENT